jgi:asparagine synthase (glutamine-hydrolysing)
MDQNVIKREFVKGKKRGPEYSKLQNTTNYVLGFHRLAINGLNVQSNQPIVHNKIVLICNGEIYNYKQLFASIHTTPITQSDCEIIIHLYLKYGIEQTLIMLDGVFAFVLLDNRTANETVVHVARDPFGVRPMYFLNIHNPSFYAFSSELKTIEHFYNNSPTPQPQQPPSIAQFLPGTFSTYTIRAKEEWTPLVEYTPYFKMNIPYNNETTHDTMYKIYNNLLYFVTNAVNKRCATTERNVACLLSGGLDSSLIAALVANYFRAQNKVIETYSIGLAHSEDIQYARIVAEYIGSKHTEIIVTEDDMFNAIPEVIQALESYDTTTVRASIGNYLLGKYIAANSTAKVIFNGDGSDELFGGYLYMHQCPDDIEFDKETRRLLKDIHLFDVLRSDKSISSNGLEPRTPFLDRNLVNYVLSLPPAIRNHNNYKECEKILLRSAFIKEFFMDNLYRQILPEEILWRKKEAFSDGVSSQGRSLFKILQDKIAEHLQEETSSLELEKTYYKRVFDELYPNCSHLLPYYWMPRYIDATDPSARTLSIYNHNTNINTTNTQNK